MKSCKTNQPMAKWSFLSTIRVSVFYFFVSEKNWLFIGNVTIKVKIPNAVTDSLKRVILAKGEGDFLPRKAPGVFR